MRYIDETNHQYGLLTVKTRCFQPEPGSCHGQRVLWLCICACGEQIIVDGKQLRNGTVTCCGCSRYDNRKDRGKNYPQYSTTNPNYVHGCRQRKLFDDVRKRDGYRCRKCGKTQEHEGRKLQVHHLNGDKYDHRESNLLTLCGSCHNIVHDS